MYTSKMCNFQEIHSRHFKRQGLKLTQMGQKNLAYFAGNYKHSNIIDFCYQKHALHKFSKSKLKNNNNNKMAESRSVMPIEHRFLQFCLFKS